MTDLAARDYSSRLGQTDRFHAPLLRDMAAWLAPEPGNRILDAGCGAGGMSAPLAAAVGPSGWVAALDLAPPHVEATRRLIDTLPDAVRATYHEGSVEALPFPDGTFDLAWCSHVLHGLADPTRGLLELHRVLRPEGRLAVREDFPMQRLLPLEPGGTRPGLEDRVRAYEAGQFAAWHDRVPYREGWAAMLARAGFTGVMVKTLLMELQPPFTEQQHAYLAELLDTWREDVALQAVLDEEDRNALRELTDSGGSHYALLRPDLHFLEGATVYVGYKGVRN